MSNNQLVLLIFLGTFTVIVLTLVAWTLFPRARRTMANRLEKSIGLAIPGELRPIIGRQATRRSRISLIGLVLGAWAAVPFIWPIFGGPSWGTPASSFLVVGATFAGGAVGAAIASLSQATQHNNDAVRYARPEAVSLDDYIAPLERRGAWIMVGLASLVFLASTIIAAMGIAPVDLFPPATIGGALVILSILFLTFSELVGSRIVGRPQPTGSEPELIWGDAMRSANVRGLVTAPIALGFYGLILCAADLASGLRDVINEAVALITVNVSSWLAMTAIILIGIFVIVSKPQRHFLRRLWPQYDGARIPATSASGDEAMRLES